MPKYKISKSNLKEFFGFFGKKNRPKDIDSIIKNDPVLQKLDKDIETREKEAGERLRKTNPTAVKIFKQYGIDI
jgi:hypothetical protein